MTVQFAGITHIRGSYKAIEQEAPKLPDYYFSTADTRHTGNGVWETVILDRDDFQAYSKQYLGGEVPENLLTITTDDVKTLYGIIGVGVDNWWYSDDDLASSDSFWNAKARWNPETKTVTGDFDDPVLNAKRLLAEIQMEEEYHMTVGHTAPDEQARQRELEASVFTYFDAHDARNKDAAGEPIRRIDLTA